jgi:hypothetical protein
MVVLQVYEKPNGLYMAVIKRRTTLVHPVYNARHRMDLAWRRHRLGRLSIYEVACWDEPPWTIHLSFGMSIDTFMGKLRILVRIGGKFWNNIVTIWNAHIRDDVVTTMNA